MEPSLAAEHSITFAVASRALHRTAIASISSIAAPRPPPPPQHIHCVDRASVRAHSPFPLSPEISAAMAASTVNSPPLGSHALFFRLLALGLGYDGF